MLSVLALTSCVIALGLVGCGDDLGECDPVAAEELVYGRGGLIATKGQALVHNSCGNAAFCHSSGAKGGARHGAPMGMSFDMLPRPSGWPIVSDERGAIWSEVRDGTMPPRGVGGQLQGDGEWMFDIDRTADSPKLPALATDEGKSILRNWLACGAPVVNATQAPTWALPSADGGSATDWQTIFTEVVGPSCSTAFCHNQAGAGGLVMLDACSARDHLLDMGPCGRPRVVPGDGSSLLLDKIEHSMPSCGGRMPPGAPLSGEASATIRAWVEAGALAEGCE